MLIINDILAFIIEMSSLILFGLFFYQQAESKLIKILFALLAVILFAVIWARFFAPNASNSLEGWIRWILEFLILIVPWILYFRERPKYIIIAGFIIFINLLIQATLGRSDL